MPDNINATPSSSDLEDDDEKSLIEDDLITTPEVPFVPTQCLFCNAPSPTLPANLAHMHARHGLFLPPSIDDGTRALAVDAETLVRYLHLVVFGYRECLLCRTVRRDPHAVQQHMMGRGHCRIDLDEARGSEYRDFYEDVDSDGDDDGESSRGHEEGQGGGEGETSQPTARNKTPLLCTADEDENVSATTLRLASGKTLSHRTALRPSRPGRRPLAEPPRGHHGYRGGADLLLELLEEPAMPENNNNSSSNNPMEGPSTTPSTTTTTSNDPQPHTQTQALARSERRALAHHGGGSALTTALARMSARDQAALVHLSPAERRAAVARRFRQQEGAGRAGSRYRGKLASRFDMARHGLGMAWNIEVIKHDG